MKYIIEGKMLGLRMKVEQEFTVNQIGYTARCNRAFQTDEHMQRHMFNHIFEDNLIIQNASNLSCTEREVVRSKTGEAVRQC